MLIELVCFFVVLNGFDMFCPSTLYKLIQQCACVSVLASSFISATRCMFLLLINPSSLGEGHSLGPNQQMPQLLG